MITRHEGDATPLVVVTDHQEYGTVRAHHERHYPERVSGTQLKNAVIPVDAALAVRVRDRGRVVVWLTG